ncbi:MAG: DUF1801 domain-containing protein [Phenylobacterium sp.]
MVQSKLATVDEFVAQADPKRAPYLAKLRDAARRCLPDHVEDMRYGMPTYSREGGAPFAFNSQKQYVSLYVPERAHAMNAEALAGADCGKSCIRFRDPAKIDFALVDKLLTDTAGLPAI